MLTAAKTNDVKQFVPLGIAPRTAGLQVGHVQDLLSPRYAYSKFDVRDHDSSGAARARTNYSPARLLADCGAANVLGGLRDRASFKNPRREILNRDVQG